MNFKQSTFIKILLSVCITIGFPVANAAPDLTVSDFFHPPEIVIGEPFYATVTVVNNGVDPVVSTDTVYYSVFVSENESLDNTDICAGYGAIVHPYAHLTAGGFYTDDVRLQVNAQNTSAGSYFLIASADSLCGTKRMIESDETNNDLIGNLGPSKRPEPTPVVDSTAVIDLTLTELIGESNVRSGKAYRVDTYLANLGTDPAPGLSATACGYYTYVYLSTDTNITTDDIKVGGVCHASLAGNSTLRFYMDVIVPAEIPRGFYYWGGITDPTEILVEEDEANNVITGNKVNVR